ncbi:HyfB [Desulforapulum autotrophicum HRM2]|uniref:HyfB n=1 Tax=Desulforapulum autotrophicum (strain ATCC 43914 / DSM 3382 / VKM B-1955 / HRM2) TaxID=177437 RepID=C0QBF3_DESAH|nr:proton-conducting transporter membrane subunit [Desulforapulum autotrophicum]ACN16955.1 HyfB [Desulforapulum autotrophicum HRM2]
MVLFAGAMIVFLAGAVFLPFLGRSKRANTAGALFALAGSVMAMAASIDAITRDGFDLVLPWKFLLGSLHLRMDPLSGFFGLVICLVSGFSAIYGARYMDAYAGKKHLGIAWSLYLILTASMMLVITAWNGVLFLIAWEIMSVSSFLLVIFEFQRPGVLKAGWIYLVATHLGTALLLVMFMVMGKNNAYDFNLVQASSTGASLVFILAVIGFGTKAGLLPFHVWLPEAHPAAPSHVSAVMSAAMIKTGIYGIIRICMLIGPPKASWGWTLIIIGAMTGIFGVMSALAQQDIKRLLAYSSVENMGIICIGLGLGFLALSTGHPFIGALGISGGMLHVLNHALFKSLLFFGAGSVLHSTHTRDMEKMGGLMKSMPVTGTTFVIASAAVCALPPLNGFISEFLIYFGAFSSLYASKGTFSVLAGILVIVSLALIGGLALACFSKAAGIVFSGHPRSSEARDAHESPLAMGIPMIVLAGLCLLVGIFSPLVIDFFQPVFETVINSLGSTGFARLKSAAIPLTMISRAGLIILATILLLAGLRRYLLKNRTIHTTGTWDCGYTAPTARMQYTASSFADPITGMFGAILGSRKDLKADTSLFPIFLSIKTRSTDLFMYLLYRPVFHAIAWVALRFHFLQRGYNQLYILYIVITLLVLLLWQV